MTTRRILMVSDDRDLVSAFAQWCQPLDLDVFMAADGRNIAKTAIAARPDLICVDVETQTGDCSDISESLSRDQVASMIPVIILLGCEDECIPSRNLCAYYLRKNLSLCNRIVPVIEELIDVETVAPRTC